MQKEVFINEHLDAYRNDDKIKKALGGRILLNHDEFVKWYSPPKIKMSERIATRGINRQPSVEKVETVSNAILELMAESVCEKKIGREYGINAVRRLKNSQFDILVLVESNYQSIKAAEGRTKTKTAANKKLHSVLGFIIVEKGECKRLPNAYSVNLICVRSEIKSKEKPKGALLLGAYLYCIKKIGQRHGLLELAGGYKNVAGFFAYSKMGFVKNTTLFDARCFTDIGNLPMSIDIAEYKYTDFIDYASGHRKFTNFRDDTGFLDIVPEKGNQAQQNMQIEIARYCNLIYQMPFIYAGHYRLESTKDQDIVNDIYDAYDDPSLDDCIDYLYESIEDLSRNFHESKYDLEPPEPEVEPPQINKSKSKTLKQKLAKYKSVSRHSKTEKKSTSTSTRRQRGPDNVLVKF
jgi:hypothetical protein